MWLNWGVLGQTGSERGCFDESGNVCRHSRGVACGPEWGGVVDSVVIDGDMAVAFGGLRCGTGCRGADWGKQRGQGGVLACRWGSLGWQSCFVVQTTRFDECSCSSSRSSVCWATDRFCVLFTVSLTVLGVSAGVWVPDNALLVVLEVVVAGLAAVVGDDVVA